MANTAASNPLPDQPESVGRYQIVAPLGRGAMGAVYRAHDTVLDREVAVKVMASGLAQDEAFRTRFEREARIVARINHPNVVAAYDLGYHTDGSPFIAMELLAGQDLSVILRTRPLDADDSAAVALQVLAGLSQAHQREIVHRDVKPANIFITEDGKVKIMDFGVARLAASAVTATGAVLGTAYYMSPEQVSGGRVDGRADIFSVGCVLFEMLAHRKPFEAENMLGILYQIANAEPDFSQVSSEGQPLVPMLQRALQKDPALRFPSALGFARDLQFHLRANANSAWARHAANVVELEPDKGSGPVMGAREETRVDAPAAGAKTSPREATVGPLTHLYDSAPTALHQSSAGDSSVTHVKEEPGAPPQSVTGPIGLPKAALAGLLVLVLAAVWWWWPETKSPSPAEPATTAAVVPPPQPAPDTAAPPETLAPEPVETAPPTPAPVAPTRPPAAKPRVSEPKPAARAPQTTPRPPADPPAAVPAPPVAKVPAAPEPETAVAEPPRVAESSAPSDAVRPAPPPPARTQAPPAPRVAAPTTSAPATTPPATTPPAAAAPAPTAPPVHRSPLKVGASQGKRFDGHSLPGTVRLGFEVEPDSPSPGGRSTVAAMLRNRGSATVQVRQIVVTTVSGDKRRSETVTGNAQIAPGQENAVLVRTVSWPAEPPWSMEVVVHTRAGETYTNTVRWP